MDATPDKGGTTAVFGGGEAFTYRPAVAYGILFYLLTLYTLSFLDRSVLALVVRPLKAELHLDDVQVSLLIGAAFSILYVIAIVPLAFIADRWSRCVLIAAGVTIWSLATFFSAFAQGFGALFLLRMGVGLGEAALAPAAYSLIADTFPRHRLGRALAIFSIGAPLGQGCSLILGGLVLGALTAHGPVSLPVAGVLTPWRLLLLAVGAPGILLGVLFFLVGEPKRRGSAHTEAGRRSDWLYMLSQWRILLPNTIARCMIGGTVFGFTVWSPTLLERTYNLAPSASALPIGIAIALGGALGMWTGGVIGDRMGARGVPDAFVRMLLLSASLQLPLFALTPLMPSAWLCFAALGVATFSQGLQAGFPAALLQDIAPPRIRARVLAIEMCVISIFIFGLAPTIMGFASQEVFGEARLDLAMAATATVQLAVAVACLAITRIQFRHFLERRAG